MAKRAARGGRATHAGERSARLAALFGSRRSAVIAGWLARVRAIAHASLDGAFEHGSGGSADGSDAMLRSLFDAAPVGMALIGTDLRCVDINEALARIHGIPVAEHIGRPIAAVLPQIAPVVEPLFRRVLHTAEPVEDVVMEGEAPGMPGVVRYWIVTLCPLRRRGELLGVGAVITEITAEKRAERRSRFLAEASARLARSLDVDTTAGTIVDLVVPQFADACSVDLARTEAGARRIAAAYVDPSRPGATRTLERAFSRATDRVLETGEPCLAADLAADECPLSDEERTIARAIGLRSAIGVALAARDSRFGVVWLGSARRLFDAADLAFAEELASRAALAMENARLYGEAQRAIILREDVISIVSHDLRNPLAVIDLSARTMQRILPPSEKDARLRKALDAIVRASGEMDRLVRDLLDLARVEAGCLEIETGPEDAGDIARAAAASIEPIAAHRHIRLGLRLPRGDARVECDRVRVLQVLSNLLGNALKFTPEGGTVDLEVDAGADVVTFRVRDSGPGIDRADALRVFDRYWRARAADRRGVGLGLAIVKGIVEAHHGTIGVDSEPGAGATFHFTLPYAQRA